MSLSSLTPRMEAMRLARVRLKPFVPRKTWERELGVAPSLRASSAWVRPFFWSIARIVGFLPSSRGLPFGGPGAFVGVVFLFVMSGSLSCLWDNVVT